MSFLKARQADSASARHSRGMMLWERARALRPGGHTHTHAPVYGTLNPYSEVSKQTNSLCRNTHTHTTNVALQINNTHSDKKPADLSITRCHKQPFSSVVLSGTIKIPVTQADLMLLLQSRRCYCEVRKNTHKHTFLLFFMSGMQNNQSVMFFILNRMIQFIHILSPLRRFICFHSICQGSYSSKVRIFGEIQIYHHVCKIFHHTSFIQLLFKRKK